MLSHDPKTGHARSCAGGRRSTRFAAAQRRCASASASASRPARIGLLIGALALGISACGGGSGGSTPDVPPPVPTPIPAVTSVPDPVGYDADKLAAFRRINELRALAGLGLLAQDTRLDQAAQAHVEWELLNDTFSHREVAGTSGFTGEWPTQRVQAAGFVGAGTGEVLSSGLVAAEGVDLLVNEIYHRLVIFDPRSISVGVGYSSSRSIEVVYPLGLVTSIDQRDSGSAVGQTLRDDASGISVWPRPNSFVSHVNMGKENPSPVANDDGLGLGVPISIVCDNDSTLNVVRFILKDFRGGIIPVEFLSYLNDRNGLLSKNQVAIIPRSALSVDSEYFVEFEGDVSGRLIKSNWSFRTGALFYR